MQATEKIETSNNQTTQRFQACNLFIQLFLANIKTTAIQIFNQKGEVLPAGKPNLGSAIGVNFRISPFKFVSG
jgi:hypothetical protein